ncbi:translation initiation factor IF-2 [Candidatus Micrarchaeota archaeon]|nr:translation initiation factor IF-2 [Candidatus Micrarchaeota archaeon]MBU1887457.1 translation initiation factor IF-2 [Candidatus Micrarchaeota archaeon]
MEFTRSPIICLLAHVDHGKTTLLDRIRGTTVAKKEAGGITQMIGASYVSKEHIDSMASDIAEKMKIKLTIPGLLFIDTPGHEAFSSLRDRGGGLADLVILLVDINQGFQPQTVESIKILKQHKTPFILAANKIDALSGWKSQKTISFLESYSKQQEYVRERLDEKLYGLMGKASEYGFDTERFDRVTDFSKQIAIVPISAKTGEGISELLMLIGGLSQKFLGARLKIADDGRGKGSVIEVKEEKGLGTTIDVIVYDGIMRKNDEIAYMTQNGVKKTRIRGLFEPNANKGGSEKYANVEEVVAAAGVKISAPDLVGVIPGSPLVVIKDFETDKMEIEKQFKKVIFDKSDEAGVVLRADSLGSVEALLRMLKQADIKVRHASVGNITRGDVISASVVANEDRFLGVVMGFNVDVLEEAEEESKDKKIQIINRDVIYKVLEDYQQWVKDEKERIKKNIMQTLTFPGKAKIVPGCIFRVSKPAIFGVEVVGGKLKKGCRIMDSKGEIIGEIREMQKEKEKVDEAKLRDELAISCEGIHIGKNADEKDILYTYMTLDEMKKWDEQITLLGDNDKEVFEEIKKILKRYF